MYSLKICHGDIKPENIVFGKDFDDIKLIDFGFAAETN